MTHISTRYTGDVSDHETQAREVFDGEALVPDDGRTVEVPYPDGE